MLNNVEMTKFSKYSFTYLFFRNDEFPEEVKKNRPQARSNRNKIVILNTHTHTHARSRTHAKQQEATLNELEEKSILKLLILLCFTLGLVEISLVLYTRPFND